jgi:hypothetical protein
MYPFSGVFWCLHGFFIFETGFFAADFLGGRFWPVCRVQARLRGDLPPRTGLPSDSIN